jgi:hypothetical protein
VPNIWSIGTDKAITAATGKRPEKTSNTDFARKPASTNNAHAAAPAATPAAEASAPTAEVTGAHETPGEPGHEH